MPGEGGVGTKEKSKRTFPAVGNMKRFAPVITEAEQGEL